MDIVERKWLIIFLVAIFGGKVIMSLITTADSSEHYAEDPINIKPEESLEQGEQFNPEFSDSLVEKLNPSSTVEIEIKTEESENGLSIDDEDNTSSSTSSNRSTFSEAIEGILNENSTKNISVNGSEKNVTEPKQLRCTFKNLSEGQEPMVNKINTTSLIKALIPIPNSTTGECALVMFYSPWCPFSAKAAPHFNALARIYPQLSFFALDAITYSALNMRYGLIAIPTVLLFHNGKAIVKYNESEPLIGKLVTFIDKYTGIIPKGIVSIIPEDYSGSLSSQQTIDIDYLLIVSWLFTLFCFCWWFLKSSLCHRIVESIRNTWREVQDQHQHQE